MGRKIPGNSPAAAIPSATPPSAPAAAPKPSAPPALPALSAASSLPRAPAPQGLARKTESPQQKGEFLYRQGLNALQQGRPQDALPLLQQSVRIQPDGTEARQTLAVTLMMQGLDLEAEPLLREGLQRSPGHPALSQLLGRLQFERGQLPAAQATLERALSTAGGDPQLHGLLALVLQRQGLHQPASTHFLAALRSDPTMPGWLTGLAASWEAMGMRAEAREALERALQSGRMNEELAAFVRRRLAQLN